MSSSIEKKTRAKKADDVAAAPEGTRRLAREDREPLAKACFEFLPTRARLDLQGWEETDIFAHS